MKLVFLYGPPAVGKLTIARKLSEITNFKLFHNHLAVDIVTSIFDFGSDEYYRLAAKVRMTIFEEAAQSNLEGMIFTYVYAKPRNDLFISQIVRVVEQGGGEVCFVQLQCDRSDLERRVLSESRKEYGKITSVEKLNELLNRLDLFSQVSYPRNLAINTSAISPLDSVERIILHFHIPVRLGGMSSPV